jgi:hypothetical protein
VTSIERARALDYLEQSREAILDATRSLNDAQWRYKASDEDWSPAECVEHVAIVERMLLRRIHELMEGPAAPDDELAKLTGKEEILIKKVPSRGIKVTAPDPARPKGQFATGAEVMVFFGEIRGRTIEYVKTTDHPVRTRTHPHMVFGPLDCYQWLIFMAAHTERHMNQLNEVKSHAGFPR